jgi:hypothetical protein
MNRKYRIRVTIALAFVALLVYAQFQPVNWGYLFRLGSWLSFLFALVYMQYQVTQIMHHLQTEQVKERLDRAQALAEIKRTADVLSDRTMIITGALQSQRLSGITQMADIHEAIAENTALTKMADSHAMDAFKEANTINRKLEQLGLEQNALIAEHKVQVDDIKATGEDTNRIVSRDEEKS